MYPEEPRERTTIHPIHLLRELGMTLLALFHTHLLATLLLAITIEEAGIPIPIPGDTLVMLAATQGPHTLTHSLAIIGVSSLAVVLGSSLLFIVVQRGGRPLLAKYGKYILLDEERVARMDAWFARRGRLAIVLGRLIPGLRIPTTIIAGISGMPFYVYLLTATFAALVWSTFYFLLGDLLGRTVALVWGAVSDLLDGLPRTFLVLSALILTGALVLGAGTWKFQRRDQRTMPLAEG
jgi:membrane protein DedA with SNARE-associated domain